MYTVLEGNSISFIDKHMTYMSDNLQLKPKDYLSNLRLKTKVRR
jgi:hypothetical protein